MLAEQPGKNIITIHGPDISMVLEMKKRTLPSIEMFDGEKCHLLRLEP